MSAYQRILSLPGDADRGNSRVDLERWVEEFPAFSAARLLMAQAARDAGSADANRKLQEAAAYASGPGRLFDLLNRQAILDEVEAFALAVEGLNDEGEKLIDSQIVDSEVVEPVIGDELQNEVSQELARSVALTAIESALEREVKAYRKAAEAEPASLEKGRALKGADVALSPLAKWALQRSAEVGFGYSNAAEHLTDHSVSREKRPLSQADLVDQFIQNKPRIGPVNADEEHPVVRELARDSIAEDVSLVTETMARIYAGQGHFGRARKAYRLLALKYPEKSVYFAAQSEKLASRQAGRK
jgi:hypothetical protein